MVGAPMAYETRSTTFSTTKRRNDVSFGGNERSSPGRIGSPGRSATGFPSPRQSDSSLYDFATGGFRHADPYHSTGDSQASRGRIHEQWVCGSSDVEMPVRHSDHLAHNGKLQSATGHSTVHARDSVRVRFDSLDDALALINETRPSYERKTCGKVPLSESHLMSLVDDNYVPKSLAGNLNQYSNQYNQAYKDQYEPLSMKEHYESINYERKHFPVGRVSPDSNNNTRMPNIEKTAPVIAPIINVNAQPKYATTTRTTDTYTEFDRRYETDNKYPKALRTPSPTYSNQQRGYDTWPEKYSSQSPPRHTYESRHRFADIRSPQSIYNNDQTNRAYHINKDDISSDVTKQVTINTDDNEVYKLCNREIVPSGVSSYRGQHNNNNILKGPPVDRLNTAPAKSYHMADSYSAYLKRNTMTPLSPPFPSPPIYMKRQSSIDDASRVIKKTPSIMKSPSQTSLTQARFSPVHMHTDACYKKVPAPYTDSATVNCTSRAGNHDYLSTLERNSDNIRTSSHKITDYAPKESYPINGARQKDLRHDEKIDNALDLIKLTTQNPPEVKPKSSKYGYGRRPPLSPDNQRRSKSPLPPVGADYRRTPSPVNPSPPARHLRDTRNTISAFETRRMHLDTNSSPGKNYVCASCNSTINSDRPGCTAMSQTFHLDCFTCVACRKRLAGGSFYAVEGKPYCEEDYLDTLDKCTVCQKPIMERILRASGKPYHPPCFKCTVCQKCLDGVPFTVDQANDIHCVSCYHEKYAPRCATCQKPITPEEGKDESYRVVAMDQSYHIECYKCEDCGMKLSSKIEGHGCYPLDKTLLCKDCNTNRVRKLTAN